MFTIIASNPDRRGGALARAGPAGGSAEILAADIMTKQIVTINAMTPVHEIARIFHEQNVSAAPVMDGATLVGIVSDGDLLHRSELGTETDHETCALDRRCSGGLARDVMTPDVICALEDTPLAEIAHTMEHSNVRRIPILRDSRLVGIVSRADIVRALAARPEDSHRPDQCDDDILRYRVIETLLSFKGASAWLTTVGVSGGVVELTGTIEDEAARQPSRIAVAQISCVKEVHDRRNWLETYGA